MVEVLQPGPSQSFAEEDPGLVTKRNFIKQMALDAYNCYEQYGWGYQTVKPVSRQPNGAKDGLTILVSMSTLWVMGLMDEFERCKRWVETELDFENIDSVLPVWLYVSYYIGSLLSCYALTRDSMFKDKALQIARILQPAYRTRSGLSYANINPKYKNAYGRKIGILNISQLLEYNYLASLTNEWTVKDRVDNIWRFIREVNKSDGLYMLYLDVNTGKCVGGKSTMCTLTTIFLSNIVKSYIQSGRQNTEAIELYREAIEAIEQNGMIAMRQDNSYYARTSNGNTYLKDEMVIVSNLGAMLSLGANAMKQSLLSSSNASNSEERESMYRINRHWQLAEELTKTSQMVSSQTNTGLAPERLYLSGLSRTFFETSHHFSLFPVASSIILASILPILYRKLEEFENAYEFSQNLAETYFTLWRLTHDPKYRDYAWEMAQAIHRHCRAESGGYSTIKNVNQVPAQMEQDLQHRVFLSATLKYLYLTFTDDSVLSLDQWVFNSHGQPLPICGVNDVYPREVNQ